MNADFRALFYGTGTNIMDETPCVEGTVGGDPAAGELPDAGMGADSGVQPEGLDGRCLVCSVEHPCLFDVLVRLLATGCPTTMHLNRLALLCTERSIGARQPRNHARI